MNSEIIYICDSVNNRNVREGELKILRKFEDQKYFEFGEDEMNIKKRYYKDLETLNKDFDALLKLKNKGKEEVVEAEEPKKMIIEDEIIEEAVEEAKEEPKKEKEVKKNYKKLGKKSSLF